MRRQREITEIRVIKAYRQSRRVGLDEWTACEAAVAEFRKQHPEASLEYANSYISQVLATIGPKRPERPLSRSRRSAAS